jgi:ubiquinone/menaquinone biosynthesis C-methylase UbiE
MAYVKIGKFRQRDNILSKINWKGNERVLDIGTGRGLLMIGAAKKLTDGKSIGIDIWRQEDMANNSLAMTMRNVEVEGVTDRVEVKNEDIRKTSFKPNSFDVILSNLCLHNITVKNDRDGACREIYRILKPGGIAVIGDLFFRVNEYCDIFKDEGMSVKICKYKGLSHRIHIPILVAIKK